MKKLHHFLLTIIVLALFSSLEFYDDNRNTGTNSSEGEELIVRSIHIDEYHAVWLGTNKGLLRFNGVSWQKYTTEDFLADNDINDLAFELTSYGPELWIATDNGVSVAAFDVDGVTGATSYTTADGLLENKITAVALDTGHTKYFGSVSGINYFKAGEFEAVTYGDFPESLLNAAVNDLATRNDSIYIATGLGIGRLIANVDGITGASRWTKEYGMTPLSGNILTITIDSRGNQWFGTDAGAEKHVGLKAKENWTLYTTSEGLIQNRIHAIAEDNQGGIWFGTEGGVSRLFNDEWTGYAVADGLASDTVYDISFDSEGNAWFATHRGISQFNGIRFTNIIISSIFELPARELSVKAYYNSIQKEMVLTFHLDSDSEIDLELFDVSGRLIASKRNLRFPAGPNECVWDLKFSGQEQIVPGVYMIRITCMNFFSSCQKILIE
jgi:ligand-binding sensor domain-containing protein